MAKEVIVYTTQYCPYCVRAKSLLKERGISFREVMFDMDDDDQWAELKKKSGMQTVPQIFHGDRVIGGYTDLAAQDAEDRLQSLKS